MKLHFIGIGGCGMNGVAQLAAHAGYQISGSDRTTNIISSIVGQASLYSESLCPSDESGGTRSRIREACPTINERRSIPYRDEFLCATSKAILRQRQEAVENNI